MKRVIFYVLMLPMVLGMMISCSEAKTDAKKLEGKWNVVEVKGEKILKEGLPYMEFDMAQNKLHGNAGCNIINGGFQVDKVNPMSISFPQVISTMMACPDMEVESRVLKALNSAQSFGKLSGGGMGLYDANDNLVMVLVRK